MMTTTETETAASDEVETSLTGMEDLLGRLVPAQPSRELFERMVLTMNSPDVLTDEEDLNFERADEIVPVTVPEDKLTLWSRMMDEAAREVTEARLKDLKATPPADFKLMRWLMAVENTTPESQVKKSRIPVRSRLGLWAMSAAATFMAVFGILSIYRSDDAPRLVQSGDINRETLNIVDEGLQWNVEKGVAEKKFHVDYKDTLEITDHNGTKMAVSVPAAQKVVVPVEIY